ncbi:flavin monoamine oxidase family protein [Methylomonas sp. MgM2]
MLDIAIVGGGLSGLSLARRLQSQRREFALFEARERFGGRVLSHAAPPGYPGFRNDLGPSWIWPDDQRRIAAFLAENGMHTFPQWLDGRALYQSERQLPPQAYLDHTTYATARRIAGGSYRLIEVLLERVSNCSLHAGHRLLRIGDMGEYVELQFECAGNVTAVAARQAVLTVPPRLLIGSVEFEPALDARLQQAMNDTPTWMAGHAKAVIYYERPFWREADYSGSVLAAYRGAALMEIFDACSESGEVAALSGFFGLPAALRRRYRDDLEALIVEQLVSLFGPEAAKPHAFLIQDWFAEAYTATELDEIPPPAHPHYGHPWQQMDHWNDKLFFGGTETAAEHGGYLEGALVAAERVASALSLSQRCKTNRNCR